jgi:hypothetical protein
MFDLTRELGDRPVYLAPVSLAQGSAASHSHELGHQRDDGGFQLDISAKPPAALLQKTIILVNHPVG